MVRSGSRRFASLRATGPQSKLVNASALPTTSTICAYSTVSPSGACAVVTRDFADESGLARLDRRRQRRIFLFPYAMFAPAFILIAGVSFIPIGYAIAQSFFRSNALNLGRYVGLQNYSDFLFTRNGWETIVNSLAFVF